MVKIFTGSVFVHTCRDADFSDHSSVKYHELLSQEKHFGQKKREQEQEQSYILTGAKPGIL